MKIADLFADLSFHSDTTTLKNFIGMVGELDMASILSATGLGELYNIMKNMLTKAGEAGIEMTRFSTLTGLSAQQMDSWTKAAEQAGLQGDVLKGTIKSLQEAQQKAKIYGMDQNVATGIGMLQTMGKGDLSRFYNDPFVFYEKVREAIQGIDPALQRQIVSLLGINEQNLIFMKNQEAFSGRNVQGVLNLEEQRKATEAWKELTIAGQQFLTITQQIGTEIGGWITPIMKVVNEMGKVAVKERIFPQFMQAAGNLVPTLGNLSMWNTAAAMGIQNAIDFYTRQLSPTENAASGNITMSNTFHFNHTASPQDIEEYVSSGISKAILDAKSNLAGRSI